MAINPMLGMLNTNRLSSLIAPIKQTMNMIRTAGNPQMMMQQMLQNNPQYAQVQRLISDNGGDAQKAFYTLANQMGINPEEILNALK